MKGADVKAKSRRRRVTFTFEFPQAESVILMGDFNQWDAAVHPMKKDTDGVWRKAVMVYPGRYEYKFLVDGNWQLDPRNENCCPNSYGSQNNILNVPPK
jgi:1,4-alpha-glucan branching enzyme